MAGRETADRMLDLAAASSRNGIFSFSDFLTPAEASDACAALCRERGVPVSWASLSGVAVWGGAEACERVMLRFGDPEELGYDEPFPVVLLRIAPKNAKFSEDLTHRDFLGALMSLGIRREMTGDIRVAENEAYVFVQEKVAAYLADTLEQVRHTSVRCERTDRLPASAGPKLQAETLTVASPRLDALIAKLWHLPRDKAQRLFAAERVFVGGRLCTSASAVPGADEIVSVHGFGRFVYRGELHGTKKGRVAVRVERYL